MSEINRPSDNNHILSENIDSHPLMIDIKEMALKNTRSSTAVWSGRHLQLNLLCVPPHSETGNIRHSARDQFLCVSHGTGLAVTGKETTCMDYHCQLRENSSVFIPCKTWLNLINTGNESLKLYIIQSLPQTC